MKRELKCCLSRFFEMYGPNFNGQTGEGGLEIWVPVAQ